MAVARFRPTLFDKLISGSAPAGMGGEDADALETEVTRTDLRFYTAPTLERFGESALRATVRRDLGWLLNTTNLEASTDLAPYPQVRTSVLNFGVPYLAGHSVSDWAIQQRAQHIRDAVTAFEPRLAPESLSVDPRAAGERENAVTYVIQGQVRGPSGSAEVRFLTDVESDTGAVTVRD
jgi:type VI secretion system protein ImpF